MEALPKEFQDVKVIRRLLFAVKYLPEDLPKYWTVLNDFICQESAKPLSITTLKTAVDNLQFLSEKAFATDFELAREIHSSTLSHGVRNPLGIVLISSNSTCKKCGGNLLTRGDRPSQVTVYTETYGTIVGTHYRKLCSNHCKGCNFTQHYGYYTNGSQSETYYDCDWRSRQYFVSSSETAFEMAFLVKYDAELLLGHISYSQKADIYNYNNGYPVQPKVCTTLEKEDLPTPLPRYNIYFVWLIVLSIHISMHAISHYMYL